MMRSNEFKEMGGCLPSLGFAFLFLSLYYVFHH
jgi:hypothetical protein